MSSYWAGSSNLAFVMSEKEFDDFLRAYFFKNPDADPALSSMDNLAQEEKYLKFYEEIEENYLDYDFLDRYKNVFRISEINVDISDGMYLVPFYINGKANTSFQGKDMRSENVYAVFALHSRDSISAMTKPGSDPYPNGYADLKQEFFNELSWYLPDDFDWDAHIGMFSYAAYA